MPGWEKKGRMLRGGGITRKDPVALSRLIVFYILFFSPYAFGRVTKYSGVRKKVELLLRSSLFRAHLFTNLLTYMVFISST